MTNNYIKIYRRTEMTDANVRRPGHIEECVFFDDRDVESIKDAYARAMDRQQALRLRGIRASLSVWASIHRTGPWQAILPIGGLIPIGAA